MSPERQLLGPEPVMTGIYLHRRANWYLVGPPGERTRGMAPTDWRLKLDPENVGMAAGWGERGLPGPTTPAEVPGVWNTIDPGYVGAAWYEAVCQPDRGLLFRGTIRLVVGAANYQTDAWLNGVYLGRHEGGYDAFAFRCTEIVRRSENRVTLRIVDPPPEGEIDGIRLSECPTSKESWYGGHGGPWGGVWFEESASVMMRDPARVWIEDVRVYGDLVNERASFRITLASDLPTTVTVDLAPQIDTSYVVTTAEVPPDGAVVNRTIPVAAPRPWSPESPTLYSWSVGVRVTGAEGYDEAMAGRLGFRTTEWRDGTFYLNGEPRYLKGALLQPTFPRTLVGLPAELQYGDVDVGIAKQAGLNLLRCHLRPPPPGLLHRCDGQGIMAHVEPPLAWIEPSGRLLEHGKRELAVMVRACGNHPSVVLWGIFNENAKATEAVGGDLMAELASLDPTRPIIENSGGAAVGETGMWAWGGQSRCWSPGWEAPRPLNDVHVYLANPLRQEARRLLTTLGDGPTLDVTPGRPRAERIESRLSADAVLVSEYGCGALPDFDAALAAFGEETHLADAVLLRDLRDDLARGLAERGLDREIGDVPSLVRQTQALQAEGVLAQTAALRRNPNVSGLILTQLADAGWEQMAGLIGLWRHPRPALDAFRRALQPRLLQIEQEDPCSTLGIFVRMHLIEDASLQRRTYQEGTIEVAADDTPHVNLPRASDGARVPRGLETLRRYSVALGQQPGGETFTYTSFLPYDPGRYEIRASLTTADWTVEGSCTFLLLPPRSTPTGAGLVLLGNGLRRSLLEARLSVPPDWTGPILAYLPSRPTVASLKLAVERARAGVHLCLAGLDPASAKRVERLIGMPLRMHSGRGNFMGMHHYVREHPLFEGVGAPCLADSTFAEVLPAWVAEEIPGAEVLAGCFTVPDGGRGFLWRGSVQTTPFGLGRLTIYQMMLGKPLGGDLGGHLLDRLVNWLG